MQRRIVRQIFLLFFVTFKQQQKMRKATTGVDYVNNGII